MLKRWAKLHTDIAASESMAAAFNESPAAAALFVMAMASCDAYGRLPGKPVLFRARVCPSFDLTDDDVAKAIDLLVETDMVIRYSVKKKDYIELCHYLEWQNYNWSRIGKPEYPAPPDWQPPDSLKQFVSNNLNKQPFSRERYGMEQVDENKLIVSEVEVEVEVDVDTTNDPLSDTDDKTVSAAAPSLKTETTKQRKQRKITEEQQLLGEFDEEEQELLDDYMACADEELKTGTTVGGRVARLKALIVVANEVEDPDAFRYGLHQANQARAANPNYVKKAALSRRDR